MATKDTQNLNTDSDMNSTPGATPPGMVSMASLADMIGVSVAGAIAAANPKAKTFGQYTRERLAGRVKLDHQFYQNGVRIEREALTNEHVDLLNQITHSGRYINRLVEVIMREDGSETVIEVRYDNKSRDQMFELRGHIRSLTDMLQQIIEVQKTEDAAEEERQMEKATRPNTVANRKFGVKSENFKAARAEA